MLHEEVNRETMQLGAKIGIMTAEEIRKALERLIAILKEQKQHTTVKHDKQSLKELATQLNAGLFSY